MNDLQASITYYCERLGFGWGLSDADVYTMDNVADLLKVRVMLPSVGLFVGFGNRHCAGPALRTRTNGRRLS